MSAITVLLSDNRYMFVVFTKDDQPYMTVTTGGVAQYDVTIRVTDTELKAFREDNNVAIALATDVATRTSAYKNGTVEPSVD